MMDRFRPLKEKNSVPKNLLPRKKKRILQTNNFFMFARKERFFYRKKLSQVPKKARFLDKKNFSYKKPDFLSKKNGSTCSKNWFFGTSKICTRQKKFFLESALFQLFQMCSEYGTAIFMLVRLGKVFNKPIRALVCARMYIKALLI